MKTQQLVHKFFITIIFILVVFVGFISIDVNSADQNESNIYHTLSVDKTEVNPGDEVKVTVRLNEVQSIPDAEKSIQTYIGILEYDTTKFEVVTGGYNEADEFYNLDPSTYVIGKHPVLTEIPELGVIYPFPTNPEMLVVRYKAENPQYLYIEVLYTTLDESKKLTQDYDVVTIRFIAKEGVSGTAEFKMVDSTDIVIGGYYPFLSENFYQINNSSAHQEVNIISKNAEIKSIKVIDKENPDVIYQVIKTGFNYYEVAVSEDTLHISIVVETVSPSAKVSGDGYHYFDEEYKNYVITVVSEDETVENEFNLLIRRLSSNNTLSNVQLINGILVDGKNSIEITPDINEYTLNVKYTETLTLIFMTAPGSNATVFIDGNKQSDITLENLEEGIVCSVIVKAENGRERQYTFTINILEQNNDVSIKEIKTDLSENVTIDDNEYTVIHNYISNEKVRLIVRPNNVYSTVSFSSSSLKFTRTEENNDVYYLSDELTIPTSRPTILQYAITVSTESHSQEYIVKLSFAGVDTESRLGGIKINGEEMPNFNPNKFEYSIGSFPYKVGHINIETIPLSTNAIVIGDGEEVALLEGANIIIITVKSQPGHFGEPQYTTQYYLSYYRDSKLNDEIALEKLLIDGNPLEGFNNNVNEYALTVPYEKASITIEPILATQSYGAKITGQFNYQKLQVGENIFVFTVTSESDLVNKQFTVKVIREGMSIDTALSKVLVDNNEVMIADGEYVYAVLYQTDVVFLNAIPRDSKATVNGLGKKELTVGENIFTITVIAQDQNYTKDYTVKIVRNAPNTNSKLKTIKIDGEEIAGFDPDALTYSYTVGWEALSIILTLEVDDENAHILPGKLKTVEQRVDLQVGLNTVPIFVEAEDGSVTTYQIFITRKAQISKDSSLKELRVEGYEPFVLQIGDEKVTRFNLIVPNDKEEIRIIAVANSPSAFVVGATTYTLRVGENQIDVVVFAEDKSSTLYRIFVFREPLSNNNYLNNIEIREIPSFRFTQEREIYYVTIEEPINKLTFDIETAHDGAKYEIVGNSNLKTGINQIEIKVTAVDGSVRPYLIFVTIQATSQTLPKQPSKSPTFLVISLIITSVISLGSIAYIILNTLKKKN